MRRDQATAVAALLLALACAAPAFEARAETGTVPGPSSSGSEFWKRPPTGTLRASKIIGVGVIGMDHVRIGSIEDALFDDTGRIRAVVIGVGGFLGVGEKYVAVPFDQLTWNTGDVPLTSGPSSVVTVEDAPSAKAAEKIGPETMPGSRTDREVLGAVQNQTSGRVTEATGSTEPAKPTKEPATVFVGDRVIHAEVRLTKAQLNDAPAFHFDGDSR